MYEIQLQLPFNGFHVKGTMSLPVHTENLIIFSHGYGHSHLISHEHRLALKMQQEGFGTLVFDLLDEHNELPDSFSDPAIASKGLITSTNWLHNHSEYHSLKLGLLGSGTGAAAAVTAAAELGTNIKAMVLLSGRLDLAKTALAKIKSPTLLITGELDFQTVNINKHAQKLLKAPNQLAIVPGASHLFEEPDKLNEAAHIAVPWFKKYMLPKTEKPLGQQT